MVVDIQSHSGILFLGYAKVGSRADPGLAARAPAFMLPHAPAAEHAARSGRPPWWEH